MKSIKEFGHQATRCVKVETQAAFSFLSDPQCLGQWSLGCFNVEVLDKEQRLLTGHSLFGRGQAYVRIEPLESLGLIRFWVGASAEALIPRILATVVPYDEQHCLVSLITYRQPGVEEARWEELMRTHETELDLIKAQLETGFSL